MYIFFLLIINFAIAGQPNSNTTYHDSIRAKEYIIENTYTIIDMPAPPENYSESKMYSINTFHPFSKMRHTSTINDKIEYDQIYESHELGLRVIPKNNYSPTPQSHLIIAGDSNVFGDGVDISHTLPVLMSQKISNSHPYNFGIRGGGPNNTLAMMEFLPWENIIKEPQGVFIYNYYDFLFERVIGYKNYILWSKGITPYYDLDDHNIAIYKGNFNQRFLTKIFNFMNSVKWIRELFPLLPRPTHQHTVLVGKVFLKMYEEYKKKFPQGHFFVAINNNFHKPFLGRSKELERELKNNNVPFVVVPFATDDPQYLFKDFHLNPKGHKLEAELILKVLPLNKITRQPNINSTDNNQVKNLRPYTHSNSISQQ